MRSPGWLGSAAGSRPSASRSRRRVPPTPPQLCCSTTSTCRPRTSASSRVFSRPAFTSTHSACRAICIKAIGVLSHPSVQAVTYWGLSDDGAWLGAPSGLVRADGTPKPAYDALRGLVKGEWWFPPTRLRTDDAGRVEVRGFLGDYRLTCAGRTASFAVAAPGEAVTTVRLE